MPIVDLNGAGLDTNLSYPYQALQAVINASWDLAKTKSDALDVKLNAITSGGELDTGAAPHVVFSEITLPEVSVPQVDTSDDTSKIIAEYNAEYLDMSNWLADQFSTFIADAFPTTESSFSLAGAWIEDALSNKGGAGLSREFREVTVNKAVEKIRKEAAKESAAVLTTFAATRYPLPPGAAASAILQISQKAQDTVSEVVGKLTEMEVENTRWLLDRAFSTRKDALGASLDYIKAMAIDPEMAAKVIGIGIDSKSKLISAASQFYEADIRAKEMVSKVGQFNASASLEAATKNQAADLSVLSEKVKVLVSRCQTLASEAASLFNNIHASVGTSGSVSKSDSTSLDLSP